MIDSILNFVFWFIVGWVIFAVLVRPWIQQQLEKKIEQLDQEIAEIRRVYKRVKIEEYSGCFYLFDADTDEFIGQGRTAQEFADRLKNNLVIQPVEGDPDVIARFRKTVPQTDPQ